MNWYYFWVTVAMIVNTRTRANSKPYETRLKDFRTRLLTDAPHDNQGYADMLYALDGELSGRGVEAVDESLQDYFTFIKPYIKNNISLYGVRLPEGLFFNDMIALMVHSKVERTIDIGEKIPA